MQATITLQRHLLLRVSGSARVLNISSAGLAFATDVALKIGELVTLLLEWPARWEDDCRVRLRLTARIIRNQDNGISAAQILAHETRTASWLERTLTRRSA